MRPLDPVTLDPETIAANREDWIDEWTRPRPALTPPLAGFVPERDLGGICSTCRARNPAQNTLPRRLLAALVAAPALFVAVFFAWPVLTLWRGLSADAIGTATWEIGVVHPLAGRRQHRPHRRCWASSPRTCWPATASRAGACCPGAGDRPVRAPDRRDGRRVSSPCSPRPSSAASGDPRRPRRVQPRRRRAHRRHGVGAPPRRPGCGGGDPRRVPLAGRARITLPLLRPAILAAASIVFVFTFTSFGVIRIRRQRRNLDDRGRDLAAGDPARRSRRRRHPRRRPDSSSSPSVVGWSAWQQRRHSRALALRPARPPPDAAPRRRAQARRRHCRRHRDRRGRGRWPGSSSDRSGCGPVTASPPGGTSAEPRSGPGIASASTQWEALLTSLRFAVVATVVAVPLGGLAALAIVASRRGGHCSTPG